MAGRADAGDTGKKDDADKNLSQKQSENLSRDVQDSIKESKDKTEQKAKPKDVTQADDRSADKFLSQGTVQATLAAHVPAIGNVAKQDPQAASTYPQWADYHAENNEKNGDVEAAKMMKDQGSKARAAIAEEEAKAKEAAKNAPPEAESTTETT
jgi:hypothetical protein